MHVATFTGIAPVGTVRRSARCACNRNGNAHDRNVFSFRVPRARISRSSEHPDESQVDLPERHTRESVESMSEMQTSSPGREDEFSDPNGDELEGATVGTLDRDTERSFDTVLQELTAIQQDGPRNTAILGTRYTSYLHQQIIELLTYANVLVGNHVFTSGAGGTNAAVIRGALRAEKPDLLTVVLPQSLGKQPKETQEQVCFYSFWIRRGAGCM